MQVQMFPKIVTEMTETEAQLIIQGINNLDYGARSESEIIKDDKYYQAVNAARKFKDLLEAQLNKLEEFYGKQNEEDRKTD